MKVHYSIALWKLLMYTSFGIYCSADIIEKYMRKGLTLLKQMALLSGAEFSHITIP